MISSGKNVFNSNPNLALTELEYLCLKIATNPGRSAIWYLKQLNGYLAGNSLFDIHNSVFFNSAHDYIGKYYTHQYVKYNYVYKITAEGEDVAIRAAKKIGLTLL